MAQLIGVFAKAAAASKAALASKGAMGAMAASALSSKGGGKPGPAGDIGAGVTYENSAKSRLMGIIENPRDSMRMDRDSRRRVFGLPSISHNASSFREGAGPFG